MLIVVPAVPILLSGQPDPERASNCAASWRKNQQRLQNFTILNRNSIDDLQELFMAFLGGDCFSGAAHGP
jgi:hypothetical protein